MQQNNGEERPAPRRHAPTSRRFWFIVLAGTLAALGYDLLPLLQGDLSALKKLLIPGALLAWLYRGSDSARWLLMALLLGFGAWNMYMASSLIGYSARIWLHVYVFSGFMVATGLYLALAGKDFERYRNYVHLRDAPKAAARRRAAGKAGR
ncbi:MAG: hypothetical protein ACN6O8_07260 [Achromobacter sp.]|uniref:hypothetical protein n=1 Tax=Achromobacter sp. TaxID=134375 RepID=UPI003D0134CF